MTDKLLENFAQLLIISVIVPLLFALLTPTAKELGDYKEGERKVETGFLKIFDENDHYKVMSESVELVVEEVQVIIDRIDGRREMHKNESAADEKDKTKKTGKDTDKDKQDKTEKKPDEKKKDSFFRERRNETNRADQNSKGLPGALYELFVGSLLVSLAGGLMIMLCFNIWKPVTEWAGICVGIWPVVPVILCAYLGCYVMTLEGKETFVRNLIYLLAVANFCFVLLKSQYHRTAVVWQLVKGAVSALIGCAICAGTASAFCIYTMLEKDTIGGKAAYLAVFGISLAAGILMAIEDRVIDTAENFDTY
ncbi:MAG: hypothetical protein ILP19_02655 [Oscillospiraceae bacterium]|nr:hypothetical protein [Oscillospiraceae bacterium]